MHATIGGFLKHLEGKRAGDLAKGKTPAGAKA